MYADSMCAQFVEDCTISHTNDNAEYHIPIMPSVQPSAQPSVSSESTYVFSNNEIAIAESCP